MADLSHSLHSSFCKDDLEADKIASDSVTESAEPHKEVSPSIVAENDLISKPSTPPEDEPVISFEAEVQKVSKFFDVLKEKSGGIADICKEDLSEIYTTLKEDAASTFSTLAQGFNALSSTISEKHQNPLNQEASTSQREAERAPITSLFSTFSVFNKAKVEETAKEVVEQERKKIYDKKFAKLVSLQNNVATYTTNPYDVDSESLLFKDFSLDMEADGFPEKAFKLLEENPEMKNIFNRIVPSVLSQEVFWTRYYFRAYLLEKDEEEKKKLIKNALVQEEEMFSWDDEDSEPEKNPSEQEKTSFPIQPIVSKEEVSETDQAEHKSPVVKEEITAKPSLSSELTNEDEASKSDKVPSYTHLC
ncbi:hypothetical protein L0F63_005680 [Massospora cicadina]|nr:hypothetical protein L0F63_005680 [Massospora cicadina]